ncbi:MAG: 6-bladed beta-propeller [bacterium]
MQISHYKKISFLAVIFLCLSPAHNYATFIPEIINKNIKFIAEIKKYTPGLNLKSPVQIEIDKKDNIYILDKGYQMIFIYNKDFIPVDKIDSSQGLLSPVCFCVDKEGFMYVSMLSGKGQGSEKAFIGIFNSLGHLTKKIYFEDFPHAENFIARAIAIDEKGTLFLAGGVGFPLIVLDKNGKFVSSIYPSEQQMGKMVKVDVTAVALTDEEIYLLSEGMGRVYVFGKDGEFIRKFARKGGSTGKLSRPRGLTIDKKAHLVYIIDYMRHTLSIYNLEGKYLTEYGGFGSRPSWFNYPNGICSNEDGRLFIADTFNQRAQIFDTRMKF